MGGLKKCFIYETNKAKGKTIWRNSICKALCLEEEKLFGVFRRQQGDRAMTQVENKEREGQGGGTGSPGHRSQKGLVRSLKPTPMK